MAISTWLFCSYRGLAFTFLLPLLEIITFFLTVGGVPKNLHFGIVNEELGNSSTCLDFDVRGFLPRQDPYSYFQTPAYVYFNETHMEPGNMTSYSDEKVEPYPLNCSFSGLSCVFLTDFYDSLETKVNTTF